jgi:hypothetical protein
VISIRDLELFRDKGLCSDGLDAAIQVLGESTTFPTFRAMAEAYLDLEGGHLIRNVVRAAALLAPEKIDRWELARLLFFNLPEPLGLYATTLGLDNWVQAQREVVAGGRSLMADCLAWAVKDIEGEDGWSESEILANITFYIYELRPEAIPLALTLVGKAVDGI